MYIEVREIEDDDIWNVLSEWEEDIEGVSLGKNSLSIGWKSSRAYRLRAWRADREFRRQFDSIYHSINGKLIRCEWDRSPEALRKRQANAGRGISTE